MKFLQTIIDTFHGYPLSFQGSSECAVAFENHFFAVCWSYDGGVPGKLIFIKTYKKGKKISIIKVLKLQRLAINLRKIQHSALHLAMIFIKYALPCFQKRRKVRRDKGDRFR